LIARIEYPRLDASLYLDRLEQMGDEAFHSSLAILAMRPRWPLAWTRSTCYLFSKQGFTGNREQFEDPRTAA
jgi:hypothetical protein